MIDARGAAGVVLGELDYAIRHCDYGRFVCLLDCLGSLLDPGAEHARQFWNAVVADSVWIAQLRQSRGEVRSLWGVTPIVSLNSGAAADRALGVNACTLVFNVYHITSDFDVVLADIEGRINSERPGDAHRFRWLVFIWALIEFDMFHLYNDRGMIEPAGGYGSPRFGIAVAEMEFYRRAGKRFYTYCYGADHRLRNKTLALGEWTFCSECPEPGTFCVCDDVGGARMLATIGEYATAMIAHGLSASIVPNAWNIPYICVDTRHRAPVRPTEPLVDRPFRVGHFPNHEYFKGTKFLEAAIAKLNSEGHRIELVKMSGKTNTEILHAMLEIDVLVDQLVSGSFGLTAIEAMSLGCPVICYLHKNIQIAERENCPVIEANPRNIGLVLAELKTDPARLATARLRGPSYVESNYSIGSFAKHLGELYLRTGDFPSAVNRKIRHSMRKLSYARTIQGVVSRLGSSLGLDPLVAFRALPGKDLQSPVAAKSGPAGQFKRRLGRPLRVLHIGNVANNAYNNACIQRRYGIEADVICYNYYHIMACPEWEDGAFQKSEGLSAVDHLAPDWWKTSLEGWRRPRWFVQGPTELCLAYLRARNSRKPLKSYLSWLELELAAVEAARAKHLVDIVIENLPRRLRFYKWLKETANSENRTVSVAFYRHWLGTSVADGILGRRAADGRTGSASIFDRVSARAWLMLWRRRWRATSEDRRAIETVRTSIEGAGTARVPFLPNALRRRLLRYILAIAPASETGLIARAPVNDRDETIQRMYGTFRHESLALDEQSLNYRDAYMDIHVRSFADNLRHYDIIQGYAIDGVIPLMNGVKNFCCYEHGTLREIPFENNLTGLMCRFSFTRSPVSFVTNSDVLPSIERLGLKKHKVCYLPHAFDDRKLRSFLAANPAPAPGRPVVFFSPTRHHWKSGNTSWQKGNDTFIRAAAKVAEGTRDFRLVLVEWGQEVDDSRRLIDKLGLSQLVQWVPPMSKRDLWRAYCHSHAVVDQFVVPALGGVGFESMVLGRRLITAIDVAQTSEFFGEPPPCLHANTVDACAARMREVIQDPDDTRGMGARAQQWMGEYHSAERIVALQAGAYNTLLNGQWPQAS